MMIAETKLSVNVFFTRWRFVSCTHVQNLRKFRSYLLGNLQPCFLAQVFDTVSVLLFDGYLEVPITSEYILWSVVRRDTKELLDIFYHRRLSPDPVPRKHRPGGRSTRHAVVTHRVSRTRITVTYGLFMKPVSNCVRNHYCALGRIAILANVIIFLIGFDDFIIWG